MESLRPELDRQGIQVVQQHLPPLPPVWANAGELQEVLGNLVNNAVDAMPAGGTLTLRTEVAGGQIRLVVQDTGIGIPAGNLERIFEPGFSTKDEAGMAKGLGLGLFLSQAIIESLGGRLEVESIPGQGTRFVLRLPAESRS